MACRRPSQLTSTVDATNTLCPIPLIRTQDHAKELKPGTEFEILATDPGVFEDIPSWCRMHGHTLLESHEENLVIRMRVRTAGAD